MKSIFLFLLGTTILLGQNWQPMHIGYHYQTWCVVMGDLGMYYAYCTDYAITEDTIINNQHYYYYTQLPMGLQWEALRYDTTEQRIYYNKNGIEYASIDFNHANGEAFYGNFPYKDSALCYMITGADVIAGRSIEYREIEIITGLEYNDYYKFYKDMGYLNLDWGNLIGAFIISGKDTLRYDTGYAPYFRSPSLQDTIYNMKFNPSVTVLHEYSFSPYPSPGRSVNYISKVWMEGYYKRGGDSVSAKTFIPTNNQYQWSYVFSCTLDSNFMKKGYDFYCKIYATDRGIFPHTSVLDSNWHKVVYISLLSSISDNLQITEFKLDQNYPNPFNPSTTIKYSIPKAGNVKLVVYNAIGGRAATIVNEYKQGGNYSVKFDGDNLASGVYFYKLEAGEFYQVKKMVVIK